MDLAPDSGYGCFQGPRVRGRHHGALTAALQVYDGRLEIAFPRQVGGAGVYPDLLVGAEQQPYVEVGFEAELFYDLHRHHGRRYGALHIDGAPPVDLPVLDLSRERLDRPANASGDDVHVRVYRHGRLSRIHGSDKVHPLTLEGQGDLAPLFLRHYDPFGAKACSLEQRFYEADQFRVVPAGRDGRVYPDDVREYFCHEVGSLPDGLENHFDVHGISFFEHSRPTET